MAQYDACLQFIKHLSYCAFGYEGHESAGYQQPEFKEDTFGE